VRIARVRVENFRNFRSLDVTLDRHAVIVGENKVGKSNLLFALRLLLDPTLPDAMRQLRCEDFWDGDRPLTKESVITISVDLADFETDENLVAVLAEHLVVPRPMVARLTYQLRPKPGLEGDPQRDGDFEYVLYGGDRPENWFGHEVRSRMPLDLLPALRDAEGDLANWRRSPLRPLLDHVAGQIPQEDLAELHKGVTAAGEAVHEHEEIAGLGERIVQRLEEMVGDAQAIDACLRFATAEPDRLLRSLRLFLENGARSVGEVSLGTANLVYLALKSLELEQLVREEQRDHSFLAIEEPEAHLHPHLQRLVYRDFLRPREHAGRASDDRRANTTVLLTTHSPHIVSVAPLRSLVVVRRAADGGSEAVSTVNVVLTAEEVADLERYLDVSRGEMVFARGVILVEGDAEEYLLPVLARAAGQDLDALGITVCNIGGTNFTPYVKLLGERGLAMPWAVLTDLDPVPKKKKTLGRPRVRRLLAELMPADELEEVATADLAAEGRKRGLFLNAHTFEVDLFNAGNHEVMCEALSALTTNKAAMSRAEGWAAEPDALAVGPFLRDIEAIGKGRFAQRVAAAMTDPIVPRYIRRGVKYVADRCR
jgi:putative ATP-dependent endonuclease of OLD family